MVLVVVFVHAIATNEMKGWKTQRQLAADSLHVGRVSLVVDGVGLRLAHDAGIGDLVCAHEANPMDFGFCERHKLIVSSCPEIVTLKAEIFKAKARRVGVGD